MYTEEKLQWINKCIAKNIKLWFHTTDLNCIYIYFVSVDEGELYANGYYCITDVSVFGFDPDYYAKERYPKWLDKQATVLTEPLYLNPWKETL